MKQKTLHKKLETLFSPLKIGTQYRLIGLRPEILLTLKKTINRASLIVVPDELLEGSYDYVDTDDKNIIIVPNTQRDCSSPAGFISKEIYHYRRSKALLSSGIGNNHFILCSELSINQPLVGSINNLPLLIDTTTSFDDCLNFIIKNNYAPKEIVTSQGEYSIRGGIIDVFSFSSSFPVRINFLDYKATVNRFNLESQLTTNIENNFSLSCYAHKAQKSLNDIRGSVLLLNSCANKITISSNIIDLTKYLNYFSYKHFHKNIKTLQKSINVDYNLNFSGISYKNEVFFVPQWFLNNKRLKVNKYKNSTHTIKNITIADIKKGDFLVHRDHGVGVCVGLGHDDHNIKQEFLMLKYNDGGILRLSLNRFDLLHFFAKEGTEGIILDSLNKKGAWTKKKLAARKHAQETIKKLLDLYVNRSTQSRQPYKIDSESEKEFLSNFPFTDTEDQASAWKEISNDLSSSLPMDRLLCGDVGFGKTELAIRASFRVIMGGFRVLVLVPTTILASQLYTSFSTRLKPYGIVVDIVSRLTKKTSIIKLQTKIHNNNNDIIIGTHAILNNDSYLHNTGLLVIDEEHRFGVMHKEKIKLLKKNIDVLSMSATPIPRSINLAMSGIYSISLLQSPPLMRLPIKTHVNFFNYNLISKIINYETSRGGQVFFVHNDIKSIKQITSKIQSLFTELVVDFVHGKRSASIIEKIMLSFVSKEIDVLICSSIIEAGIDVSNANCIIINNAHLFGLSQLYQMRGRVGRGDRQAFAYLLIPQALQLSNLAFNRMKAVSGNTRLGAGYNISQADMEIRGSGSLFGYKQSGGSSSIGYEMYLKLIQESLHSEGVLSNNTVFLLEDIVVDLYNKKGIPENFISSENQRISFYKSFVSANTLDDISLIEQNLINRYGPLPLEIVNLANEYRIRILCSFSGISSIKTTTCGLLISLSNERFNNINENILTFINNYFNKIDISYHIVPSSSMFLLFCLHINNNRDKYSILFNFLNKLYN